MKRIAMPKRWPIARKGTPRFILEPRGSKENSLAVLVVGEIGKHFILVVKGKRLSLKEISEKEASVKISKIIGKKVLNSGKIQFNLFGGVNSVGDIKAKVGDSVLVDLKQIGR